MPERIIPRGYHLLLLTFGLLIPAAAAEESTVRLTVTADTHLAAYPGEEGLNHGASGSLKIKHRENFPLLKLDLSALPREVTVTEATLFVHARQAKYFLNHVSVSTVPTDWVEGEGTRRAPPHDAACLLWPGPRDRAWGWRQDRDILGSIFGNAGNLTCLARARRLKDDWWALPLAPRMIDALKLDQPGGLILHDEMIKRTGAVANIRLHARDQSGGRWAPYVKARYRVGDATPPGAPEIVSMVPGPEAGELLVTLRCSGDDGRRGQALGFDIRANGRPVPRYMIPRPAPAGSQVVALLEGLTPATSYRIAVTAYDEAGHRSPAATAGPVRATGAEAPRRPAFRPPAAEQGAPLASGPVSVYAVDGLTKLDPQTGKTIGGGQRLHRGNHIYHGQAQRIELFGARGEILGVNLVVETAEPPARPIEIRLAPGPLSGNGEARIGAGAFRFYNPFHAKIEATWVPTALPVDPGPFTLPSAHQSIPEQRNRMIPFDLSIPGDAEPGLYRGTIALEIDGRPLKLPVRLRVFPVTLPDRLQFLVELNAYGARDRARYHALHRLAHAHRLGYNVVPYGHSGQVTVPFHPGITGTGDEARVSDWRRWDRWMAPLLDGSLFEDMPRAGQPIPHAYLPFYENWPMPLHPHYTHRGLAQRPARDQEAALERWRDRFAREAPLISEALTGAWRRGNRRIAEQFREHFEANGWTATEFQVYLNNKYYKGDLSYWTLDEPAAGHDFRAVAEIHNTFMEPFAGSKIDVVARSDVSRPQFMGDRMDAVPNRLLNMSGGYHAYRPLVRRMIVRRGVSTWLYGGGPPASASNATVNGIILAAWVMGADGGMPYWTAFGGSNEWTGGSPLRLVFTGRRYGYEAPVTGSLRLLALRRGQQDAELLSLLAGRPGYDRWRIARSVRHHLNMARDLEAAGADDPGRLTFTHLTPADLHALRLALLRELGTEQEPGNRELRTRPPGQ